MHEARLKARSAGLAILAATAAFAPPAAAQESLEPERAHFGFNDDWSLHGDKLGTAAAAGADTTRAVISWRVVEPSPGKLDWSAYDELYRRFSEAGTRPQWVLADAPCWAWTKRTRRCAKKGLEPRVPKRRFYDEWLLFAAGVAYRYPDSVAIESWNEPNLGDFWKPRPDPAKAAELAAYANLGVDIVNGFTGSDVPVVLGGLAPLTETIPKKREIAYDEFIRSAYEEVPGGYWDGVAIHPFPRFKARERYLDDIVGHLDTLREALRDSGAEGAPIWVSEIGLSTAGPFRYSPTDQAIGLADIYRSLEAMPDVVEIIVHRFVDGPRKLRTAESGWGVLAHNGGPKPALCALASERGVPCQPGRRRSHISSAP